MALVTRLSRLFRADLHAVLDRMEEPDILLRQAVREMEENLDAHERRLKLLVHEQEHLAAGWPGSRQLLAQLDREMDVCFASGKPDLARVLVRRKLETERRLKLDERKRERLAEAIKALGARIAEERSQLDSMRQKAELLAEGERTARAAGECGYAADLHGIAPVREEDVDVACLLEQQKRRQA